MRYLLCSTWGGGGRVFDFYTTRVGVRGVPPRVHKTQCTAVAVQVQGSPASCSWLDNLGPGGRRTHVEKRETITVV